MKRELPMSRETGGGWMPLGKRDRGTGSFSEDILSNDILQEIEEIRNIVNQDILSNDIFYKKLRKSEILSTRRRLDASGQTVSSHLGR